MAYKTWVKQEAGFYRKFDRGPDTTLICSQTFENSNSEATVESISIFGYKNGRFKIAVNAVNDFTNSSIKKQFKHFDFRAYVDDILIYIKDADHLSDVISYISKLDYLDSQTIKEITENYCWFQQTSKKVEPLAPLTNQTQQKKSISSQEKLNHNLFDAVDQNNPQAVEEALLLGADPNVNLLLENFQPLIRAINNYSLPNKDKSDVYRIIKLLLFYGADPLAKHPHFHKSALTLASESNHQDIVDLLLSAAKEVEFKISEETLQEPNDLVKNMEQQFKRIKACKNFTRAGSDVIGIDIEEQDGNILTTFKREGDKKITAVQKSSEDLTSEELMKIFELYSSNFEIKFIGNLLPYFSFMLKPIAIGTAIFNSYIFNTFDLIASSKKLLFDIIRNEQDEIVGFNCFDIIEGEFNKQKYKVVYCRLACVEKEYRGTRIMSLLSFRGAHALKQLHPDEEIYVFFDAIHINSYRQIFDLPHYPKNRCECSREFVLEILKKIYGEEKAKEFDGIEDFFIRSESSVSGGKPNPETYDLPIILKYFDEQTRNKENAGIPVIFPVSSTSFDFFANSVKKRMNGADFGDHIEKLAELISPEPLAENQGTRSHWSQKGLLFPCETKCKLSNLAKPPDMKRRIG